MFFLEYCKVFKNSSFIEHFWWLPLNRSYSTPPQELCILMNEILQLNVKNKVTHEYMPKVISGHNKISSLFIMKSLLNVNLYTWSAFISHVVCLVKTSNSWYKYSGPFLGQKFYGIGRILNVFKIQFFPVENIFFLILW